MHAYDLIIFFPEVLVALFGLGAVGFAAFFEDRAQRYLQGALWIILLLSLVILVSFYQDKFVFYGFSDLLVSNTFTLLSKILLVVFTLMLTMICKEYWKKSALNQPEFLFFLSFALLGLMLMVSSNHLVTLFLSMELASFSQYLMVAFQRDKAQTSEASLKYFILGALGTAFYLYGASLLFGSTGTLSFPSLAHFYTAQKALPIMDQAGMVFIILAFAFKLSLAPFHAWTPDVYQGAPTPVVTFLITLPKVAAFALLMRLFYEVFPGHLPLWSHLLTGLSLISMMVGSLGALVQTNIKRIIAHSTIAHMGYGLLGLLETTATGAHALMIYIALYGLTNLGLMGCLLTLHYQDGEVETLDDLRGLSKSKPYIAAAMSLFLFSLAGMPPLAGFFAKLTIFSAAMANGHLTLVMVGVITSVIAAGFYLKIISSLYFQEPMDDHDEGRRTRFKTLDLTRHRSTYGTIFVILALITLYAGISHLLPPVVARALKPLMF